MKELLPFTEATLNERFKQDNEESLLGAQVREVFCTWAVQEQCEATRTKQNMTRETEEPIKAECFSAEPQ